MNTLAAILWKDIINELRTKEIIFSMAAFSVVLVVIFNFSLVINKDNISHLVPSLLWISIIFVGTLGLSRTFAIEKENSAITGILISPVDRSMLYFAKVLSNLLYIIVIQLLLLFLFIVLFNINLKGNTMLLIVVMLLGAGPVEIGRSWSIWCGVVIDMRYIANDPIVDLAFHDHHEINYILTVSLVLTENVPGVVNIVGLPGEPNFNINVIFAILCIIIARRVVGRN